MDFMDFSKDIVIQATKEDLIKAFKEVISEVENMQRKVWLNVDQVSKLTGYAKVSIYKMVQEKEIPHYKKTGKLMFLKSEVEEWINSYKVIND